jgi:hypothetical protein
LSGDRWLLAATDSEEIFRNRVPLSCYFPDTIAVEIQRDPKQVELFQMLSANRFEQIAEEIVEFRYELSDSTAFARKAFSGLHLISEDAFQTGLKHLERDLQVGPISCISRYAMRHNPHGRVDCREASFRFRQRM